MQFKKLGVLFFGFSLFTFIGNIYDYSKLKESEEVSYVMKNIGATSNEILGAAGLILSILSFMCFLFASKEKLDKNIIIMIVCSAGLGIASFYFAFQSAFITP